MIKKLTSIRELAEELEALLMLEYHNKTHLQGDERTRNMDKRGLIQRIKGFASEPVEPLSIMDPLDRLHLQAIPILIDPIRDTARRGIPIDGDTAGEILAAWDKARTPKPPASK